MFVLYLTNTLGLGTAIIGFVITAGGVGLLAGTIWPMVLSSRIGLGRGIVVALLTSVPFMIIVALAGGPPWMAISLLLAAFVVQEFLNTLADTNQFGLRNAVTPDRLRGRVASAARVILRSTVPIGFVIGGAMADAFGYRAAIFVGAVGPLIFGIMVARSPIMGLRDLPPDADLPIAADPVSRAATG